MAGSILILGDVRCAELTRAVENLAKRAEVACVAELPDALQWLAARPAAPPQVIMVAESRPGAVDPAILERLHCAAPLARLAALLGSWSEGQLRSGHPWPGVLRTYWHQAELRFAAQVRQGGCPAGWDLPRVATDADRLLHELPPAAQPLGRGFIAVRAAQLATYESLSDGLGAAGYATVWWRAPEPLHVSNLAAVVWDLEHAGPEPLRLLAQQRSIATARSLPWLALLGFPRVADMQQLDSLGITRCLAKPFLLTDLWRALEPQPSSLGPSLLPQFADPAC